MVHEDTSSNVLWGHSAFHMHLLHDGWYLRKLVQFESLWCISYYVESLHYHHHSDCVNGNGMHSLSAVQERSPMVVEVILLQLCYKHNKFNKISNLRCKIVISTTSLSHGTLLTSLLLYTNYNPPLISCEKQLWNFLYILIDSLSIYLNARELKLYLEKYQNLPNAYLHFHPLMVVIQKLNSISCYFSMLMQIWKPFKSYVAYVCIVVNLVKSTTFILEFFLLTIIKNPIYKLAPHCNIWK